MRLEGASLALVAALQFSAAAPAPSKKPNLLCAHVLWLAPPAGSMRG
jgi:hypothetical protein